MFTFKLKDRDGTPVNLGDIVEISDGKHIKFFARVQWMPAERALSPFHTFSFHSVRRVGDNVECLPDDVVQCTEPRFDCWYLPNPRPDADAGAHEHYLAEWRKCERFMESCFDIELYPPELPEIPGIGTVTMHGLTSTFTMGEPEPFPERPDITIDEFELAVAIAPAYSGLSKRKVFTDTKGQIWMTAIRDGDLWLFMWEPKKTGFTTSKQISPNGFISHGDKMRIIPDPAILTFTSSGTPPPENPLFDEAMSAAFKVEYLKSRMVYISELGAIHMRAIWGGVPWVFRYDEHTKIFVSIREIAPGYEFSSPIYSELIPDANTQTVEK